MPTVTETTIRPVKPTKGFLNGLWKQLSSQISFVVGVVSAVLGTAEMVGAFGKSQVLDVPDPLVGLPFRHLMLVLGLIHLAVSFVLIFTHRRTLGLGLAAWSAVNFMLYRIGLWNMGWHHSSGFNFDSLGVSLKITDAITSLLAAFLLIGSCIALWFGRWRTKTTSSFKISCPACGGHVKFSSQNLGQKIPCPHCQKLLTLRQPDANLKTSCFFCQGHIEFPAHAIGEKMPCPHCKMDITLKEPV